jgi:hypothetical protein
MIRLGQKTSQRCPQKALAACRKHKGKLIIAKLDRLSRNLAFIATLMDSNVEFIAADNPHANRLTVLSPQPGKRPSRSVARAPMRSPPTSGPSSRKSKRAASAASVELPAP